MDFEERHSRHDRPGPGVALPLGYPVLRNYVSHADTMSTSSTCPVEVSFPPQLPWGDTSNFIPLFNHSTASSYTDAYQSTLDSSRYYSLDSHVSIPSAPTSSQSAVYPTPCTSPIEEHDSHPNIPPALTFTSSHPILVCTCAASRLNFSTPALPASTILPLKPKSHICSICTTSFSRFTDLKRHAQKHSHSGRIFSCSIPGCSQVGAKAYYRKDKLHLHLRTVHGAESPTKRRNNHMSSRQDSASNMKQGGDSNRLECRRSAIENETEKMMVKSHSHFHW